MAIETRRTGKTTRLIEKAIRLLGLLPEDHTVFITGAYSQWLDNLHREFRKEGLVGVEFLLAHQVINGALWGRKGLLLIDDVYNLTHWQYTILKEEQRRLEERYGVKGE